MKILTVETNSCLKRSEGEMFSNTFKMLSLEKKNISTQGSVKWIFLFWFFFSQVRIKSSTRIPTHTAKSSSKSGACLTAGNGLAVSHSSRHKFPGQCQRSIDYEIPIQESSSSSKLYPINLRKSIVSVNNSVMFLWFFVYQHFGVQ